MRSTIDNLLGARTAAGSGLLILCVTLPAAGQTPPAGRSGAEPATGQEERPAAPRNSESRDGIRGLREQDSAARRTATQLNRDAREEAREQASALSGNIAQVQANAQAAPGNQSAQGNAALNANLRSADLGLWLSNPRGNSGLVVSDLADNSAFAKAGLREGDQIVSLNGRPIANERQFVQMLLAPGQMNQNQSANLAVMRNGQQQNVALQPNAVAQGIVAPDPFYQTGLSVDQTSSNSVVVRNVFPRTAAFYAGLRPGDVITGLNGGPITLDALTQALANTGNTDLGLAINRNGQSRQLTLNTNPDGSLRTAQNSNLSNNTGANINGINGGALSGTATGLTTAGRSALDGRTSVGGVGTSAAGLPQTTTNPAAQPGFPTSPSALGNPTSPALSIQQPIGARTSVPGTRTSVPGLPTAGPTAGPNTNPAGVISGTTSSQGTVVPGVSGGNTGLPSSSITQGGNLGAPTSATRAFGSASAAGATGTTGGAGSTAGGAGVTGGTGAISGGAGSTAGPSGGATGARATGAGAGGAGAGGSGSGGGAGGGAGGGGGAGAGGT